MIKINYDPRFDVLYIDCDDKHNSYGDDDFEGIVVLRNLETDKIVGLTIFDFNSKYSINKLPKIPSDTPFDIRGDIVPLYESKYKQ